MGFSVPRLMRVLLPVAALALVIVGVAAASSLRGIEPVFMSGGVSCSDLQNVGSDSVRFNSPANGASQDGVSLFVEGNALSWYVLNNVPAVRAVIVKGGKDSNVYYYPYPPIHFSDGGLYAPTNPKNGKPYGLGYAEFCLSAE